MAKCIPLTEGKVYSTAYVDLSLETFNALMGAHFGVENRSRLFS